MGLYTGGLIIGRIFASEIWWGLIFGRAYFWGDLLSEFYGMFIERYCQTLDDLGTIGQLLSLSSKGPFTQERR